MYKQSKISAPLLVCMIFCSCLQHYNNYGVVDTPVTSPDNNMTVVIVAENSALTHQENGGFRKTTYNTSYWLKQYETATGKLLKKKKLTNASENNNNAVACYGAYGTTIWLYIDKLRAYNMNNLEETTNEEKIASANGVNKNIFPYGSRLIKPAVEKGFIDFISDNGEEYRLSLTDLKIINKESIPEDEDAAEMNIRKMMHYDDYGTRCDTLDNKMYMLAKDSSEAKNINPSNYSIHEVAYRMKLFEAGYNIRKLGNHTIYTQQSTHVAGEASYLNPCFAKDTYHDVVIQFSNPEGYLIIHQDVLGEKSKAIITRIDTKGKKIWETVSSVSTKISDCIMSGRYCIVTTNKDYMLSPFIGKDALCIIDTENGHWVMASLND